MGRCKLYLTVAGVLASARAIHFIARPSLRHTCEQAHAASVKRFRQSSKAGIKLFLEWNGRNNNNSKQNLKNPLYFIGSK